MRKNRKAHSYRFVVSYTNIYVPTCPTLHGLTFFIKNGDDNQEIACEAERGGDDDSARREDVGVEGLLRAAGPGHQQVADGNEDAGGNHDAAAGEERAE